MAVTLEKTQGAYAADLVVILGGMSVRVDAVPQKVPNSAKATSFHRLCPDCKDPSRLHQENVCDTHGIIDRDREEERRGREVDGVLTDFTEDEIAAVTGADLTFDDGFKLDICHAHELEAETRPDGTNYRLRPCKKGTVMKFYAMFRQMASNPEFAYHGDVVLKGHQKHARLRVWNDQLILECLVRSDDLVAAETIDAPEIDAGAIAMGEELTKAYLTPFDASLHTNGRKERMLAMEAEKAANPGKPAVITPIIPAAPKDDENDLMAALTASLAAKRATAAA